MWPAFFIDALIWITAGVWLSGPAVKLFASRRYARIIFLSLTILAHLFGLGYTVLKFD